MRLNKPLASHLTHCQRHTDQRTCNTTTNRQLHHALQCPFGPYRNQRHNAVRDTLSKIILRITGQEPLKEQFLVTINPQAPNNHPDDDAPTSNRADITWHTATGPVHLDVMVTSAFTHAALAGASTSTVTPGYAAAQGEQYKRRKYSPHNVVPIVFETHGRIGNDTATFLTKLIATLPESERQHMYHHALQQLSTSLQLHNAITLEAHTRHHLTPHQNPATPVAV